METENKTNIVPTEVENTTTDLENKVETTNELAENCESAEQSAEDTEDGKENEQKKEEKPEPLPEQKPFILSRQERRVLDEMERRAKEIPALAEGLKDKDKSIQECYAFITHRAKKMAEGNSAMIEDEDVFAWAIFYYTQRRAIIELEFEKPKAYTPAPKAAATANKKTDTKASTKVKTDTAKTEKKETPKAEVKDKNIEEVKGGDGKVYKIETLSLF